MKSLFEELLNDGAKTYQIHTPIKNMEIQIETINKQTECIVVTFQFRIQETRKKCKRVSGDVLNYFKKNVIEICTAKIKQKHLVIVDVPLLISLKGGLSFVELYIYYPSFIFSLKNKTEEMLEAEAIAHSISSQINSLITVTEHKFNQK